ncbi:MAG TPA: class I SAM-dependent methyltransferase [Terriglobales bacterium]|jgi:SAM-dependent methyltransferase
MNINLWDTREHALDYIQRRENSIPHRAEAEAALLEHLPAKATRILDIGTGAGRLIGIAKQLWPQVKAVGVDFSPPMLELSRERFAGDSSVTIETHNLDEPLPDLGMFDVVMSSLAIHHVADERKRSLYKEVFNRLVPGGVFCNLEHVASPSERLHFEFLKSMDVAPENDDPSNKLLDMETQLRWLREIGFTDVDCHWKWRELALLAGRREA